VTSIRWAPPAVDDFNDIARYIASESTSAAATFIDRVDNAVTRFTTHPRAGRIVPELERHNITRHRELVLAPWRLFYRQEQDAVFILAIIDGRRNIEDILLRRLTRTGSPPDDERPRNR
jgi:toxin ParE1/3/4